MPEKSEQTGRADKLTLERFMWLLRGLGVQDIFSAAKYLRPATVETNLKQEKTQEFTSERNILKKTVSQNKSLLKSLIIILSLRFKNDLSGWAVSQEVNQREEAEEKSRRA